MKHVIVTGATGAIGTALIKEFINNNVKVLVFTRKESKRNLNIPKHKLVEVRYYSLEKLYQIQNVNDEEYDVFYHLAWSGTFGESRSNFDLQQNNIKYTLDAIDCAKRFGCKKFIGIGSQAEYGRVNEPLFPNTRTNPDTEYGKAKLEAGILAKKKCNEEGIEFNWIRVLSIYGPNDGENTLVSLLINSLKNNLNIKLTKGEQIWDYLYSEDAAQALLLIGEKGLNGKTYVLGSGIGKPLKEYIEIIKNIINPKAKLEYGTLDYSKNQVMYLCGDISELKNDVGWEPKTSFEKGIESLTNQYEK